VRRVGPQALTRGPFELVSFTIIPHETICYGLSCHD
jgi:hypothetical protein